MKLSYLRFLMPGIFGLRMADDAPAVVVTTGEAAPAPDVADVQRAADASLETAAYLAEKMTRTPEETNAIITAIGVLAQSVNDLGLSLFARLDEIRALAEDARDAADDAADAADEAAEAGGVADAAIDVAEAAAETAQAVPAVAEAQAAAEVAEAEQPAPRGNERRARRYI